VIVGCDALDPTAGTLPFRDDVEWWMTTREGVGSEVFPLTADGIRLNSLTNELDDRMREA
jgi:hypothetical protein